jgi:hypothetical protein
MVKYLLDRDWARLEGLIQSETQRLLALFPRLRKRIVWDMLQWRIMLENERGDDAAELRLLRERMRMRPQTPWGRSSDYLSVALLLRKQGDTEGAVRELNRGIRFASEHGDSTVISLMLELAKLGQLPLRARYIRAVQMVSTRFLEEPVAVPRTSEELERLVAEFHRRQHTPNHGR